MKTPGADPRWVKTPVANLIRYVPSGVYFARVRVGGKLIHKSLRTDKISVAQLRLNDLTKEERENLEARAEAARGRMAFREARASTAPSSKPIRPSSQIRNFTAASASTRC